MAESIIVHFLETDRESIARCFNSLADFHDDSWYVPNRDSFCLSIYSYKDYSSEYDEGEKVDVVNSLGHIPNESYCFEFRRSVQDDACSLAKEIITNDLSEFLCVVDDCLGRVWTIAELTECQHEFLRQYHS